MGNHLTFTISTRKAIFAGLAFLAFAAVTLIQNARLELKNRELARMEREYVVPYSHFYTGNMMSNPFTGFDGVLNVTVAKALAQFLWKEYGAPRKLSYEIVGGECLVDRFEEQWRGSEIRITMWTSSGSGGSYSCDHYTAVKPLLGTWLDEEELVKEFLGLMEQIRTETTLVMLEGCSPDISDDESRPEAVFIDYKTVHCSQAD